MRTTLCLFLALVLAGCGGSDTPAPKADHSKPAAMKAAPDGDGDEGEGDEGEGEGEGAEDEGDGSEAEEAAPAAEGAAPEGEAVAADAPAAGGNAEAGKTVYNTFCMACHQADGKGMGGALAADFVGDKTRLAKTDEQLLNSIANGVPGTTMIAWGGQLDETKRKDVLAYIRATFGQ